MTWFRFRKRAGPALEPETVLIAYASQTGMAATLAETTARDLTQSGCTVALRSFAALTPQELGAAKKALFIASTTGEGHAPDDAITFLRKWEKKPQSLDQLHYALLALGDRNYRHFCGFGHDLDHFLRDSGAHPAADLIEVDQCNAGSIRHWQQNLRLFGASAGLPDWTPPRYTRWRLVERELLNAGSPGAPMYGLRLAALDSTPPWRAGDVAEVYPGSAEDGLSDKPQRPHRDYTIATIPDEEAIGLTVRLFTDDQGRTGLGSGWLCEGAAVGADIALRIRPNPQFHAPAPAVPLILIGNGTGISGLRAHLRARPEGTRNWLIFGERDAATDRPFDAELEDWARTGHLERIDRIFSRAGGDLRYVQHVVPAQADLLRDWIKRNAAIFVCGSVTMGNELDAALRETLGEDAVEEMITEGRYRRDIY